MQPQTYRCGVDAEPLHRYQPGGYHPVELGDVMKNGRYRILHKLGWGSYSTTWAAKDQEKGQYVAIKVSVSDIERKHELDILREISSLPRDHHPGWSHLNYMLDVFTVAGPNGSHDCLVLELVGPNVAEAVASYYKDDRLPAGLAKRFAKQTLQGLDVLASQNIGHGDLHTRNLAVVIPDLESLDEASFIDRLGKPESGPVSRQDGNSLGNNVPSYIVRPAPFRKRDLLLSSSSVKIIDFGEAFFDNKPPNTLHTPLSVRAPEVVFGDSLDHRVDLWSAGCLIFELLTGQPPFDVFMLTPPILVQQMMGFATDGLPSRWQTKWETMQKCLSEEDDSYTLQEWLEEVYFDDLKHTEFTKEDIASVARLIDRMLKFEPSLRATASDTLADVWFNRE
ncbi:CMGC SRPK kinase [Fusarium albosuccineum]|uniref:non-specific serine/threonine protein kinase n=1 Tax=Fusarium albosuccineum TaxID=1237068 RepID=A0A8H4L9M8_9HYPO|nr:CMGC SRPK kinase [Fusarium albosuccineum]